MEKDLEHNISEEDLRLYFGENAETYIDYWKGVNLKQSDVSYKKWHWPGFFVGIFWMLYRKLYMPALIIFAALVGFELIIYLAGLQLPREIDNGITFGLGVAIALGARQIALWQAYRDISAINKLKTDKNTRDKLIEAKGGTSWTAVLIALLILIILISLALYAGSMKISNYSEFKSYGVRSFLPSIYA